jgi:hypothetical protein
MARKNNRSRRNRRSNGGNEALNLRTSAITDFSRVMPEASPPCRVENPQITRWVRLEFSGASGGISYAGLANADQSAYGTSGLRYNSVKVLEMKAWAFPNGTNPSDLIVSYNHPEGSVLNTFSVEGQSMGSTYNPRCGLRVPVILQVPQLTSSGFNCLTWSTTGGFAIIDVKCCFQ